MSTPEVLMLCGLTGSGKSTYADGMVKKGYELLSLDETMHERHGRAGIDYPAERYTEFENAINEELKLKLVGLLAVGASVVMDYGFWRRANRDNYKALIEKNGGVWRLIYFKASNEVLAQRLNARNKRNDANAVNVTESMLERFIAEFEEPDHEGEELVRS
jgi:predicted kinase